MKTVVMSIFEGGYQPITALSAFTALQESGHDTEFFDLYVEGEEKLASLADSEVFVLSVPLYDALKAVPDIVGQIKAIRSDARIVFFGQYATINAGLLAGSQGDYAVVGEWEHPLVGLLDNLTGKATDVPEGIADGQMVSSGQIPKPYRSRNHMQVPNRRVAPSLAKYPQPHLDKLLGKSTIVGGLETTRGCHHKCTYCSVFAAYDGKVILSSEDIVVRDVANLVDQGMEHLTFIDADFFNAKRYAMNMLRSLHKEFPSITYDLTTRVDHILENPDFVDEMADLNVRVITSALEFPSQTVLDQVYKEMTVPMIEEAIASIGKSGIILNPTFIMFNPWVGLEDIAKFHDFVTRNGLEELIDPIQYETRLHLYKGSPLLLNPTIQNLELTEQEFHIDWKHPDPLVDELYLKSRTPPSEVSGFKRCCLKC
ncbi:MAG: arsinothricin biosynthesis radical SAM protein ArsL [Geminicoccaceae bacterium]